MRRLLVPLVLACVACSGGETEEAPDAGTGMPDAGSTCRNLAREFDVPEGFELHAVTANGDRIYFAASDPAEWKPLTRVYSLPIAGSGPEELLFEREVPEILTLAIDGDVVWTIEEREGGNVLVKNAPEAEPVVFRPQEPWWLYGIDSIRLRANEVVVSATTRNEAGESEDTLIAFAKDGSTQRLLVTREENAERGWAKVSGDDVWFFGENGVARRPLEGGDVVEVVSGAPCSHGILGDTHFACRSSKDARVYARSGGEPSRREASVVFDLRDMALEGDVLWTVGVESTTFREEDDVNHLLRMDAASTADLLCGPVGRSLTITEDAVVTWTPGQPILYFFDR